MIYDVDLQATISHAKATTVVNKATTAQPGSGSAHPIGNQSVNLLVKFSISGTEYDKLDQENESLRFVTPTS